MLTPPESFGVVEEGVYRCSAIDPSNITFLETLGLKCIISINPEKPGRLIRNFAHDHQIDLRHVGLRTWRSGSADNWMLLSKALIQDCMRYVLDKRRAPLLILDATNACVGVLRRLQHWSYSSVIAEYRTFVGDKSHYMTDIFLEMLDIRCVDYEEGEEHERTDAVFKTVNTDKTSSSGSGSSSSGSSNGSFDKIGASAPTGSTTGNSEIIIRLPREETLPDWFLIQHQMWKEDEAAMASSEEAADDTTSA